jgi:hypothetical protein
MIRDELKEASFGFKLEDLWGGQLEGLWGCQLEAELDDLKGWVVFGQVLLHHLVESKVFPHVQKSGEFHQFYQCLLR